MSEDFRVNGSPADTKQKPIVQYWLGRSSIYRLMQQYLHNCNNTSIVLDIEHLNFVPRPIDPATEVHVPDDVTEAVPQLPEFRDNLNRIIDIAQAIDSDILIMTQPSLYEDTDEWRALYGTSFIHQGQIYDLNAADWRRMLNEYNRVTLEVCEARGVACYDLASHIPSSQDYFFDLVHFTEAGAALVAENVAGAVREQLWEGNSTPP
jgi:hypothetical protein